MTFLNKAYDVNIQGLDGSIFQSYGTDWDDVNSNKDLTYTDDRYWTHPCGGVSEEFVYWYVNDYGSDSIEYYRVLIGPDPVDSKLQARQAEFAKELAIPFWVNTPASVGVAFFEVQLIRSLCSLTQASSHARFARYSRIHEGLTR